MTPKVWIGWLRQPRGRWLPVVWSFSEAEAGRQLTEHACKYQHCDTAVLEEGLRPDRKEPA